MCSLLVIVFWQFTQFVNAQVWSQAGPCGYCGGQNGTGIDWAKDWPSVVSLFDVRQGQQIFLLYTPSRLVLWPTQSPIEWMSRASSFEVKRPECEAENPRHLVSRLIKSGAVPPCPHMPSWRGQKQLYLRAVLYTSLSQHDSTHVLYLSSFIYYWLYIILSVDIVVK
jgi:hypothetical protein